MNFRSQAKINLCIHLLEKRPDGYHELVTLMEAVDLADDLIINQQKTGITVTCTNPVVPTDDRNLVVKAVNLVKRKYKLKDQGVSINIIKRIPVAAGLAGGSGNAAMTLHGLNRLWALGLKKEQLIELAVELGSDVPFCLYGGAAIAFGRGEKVIWLDDPGTRHYVLVCPPISVSSGWAYSRVKLGLTKDRSSISLLSSVMQTDDFKKLISCLNNDLEAVVSARFPEINRARGYLSDNGVNGMLMSGSGPAVFGLVSSRKSAERIASDVRNMVEPFWQVFAVSSIAREDEDL